MKQQVYLVDGYNMIGAWPELIALKNADDIESARDRLLQLCSNFQQFEGIDIWVVFDAQFVPGIQQNFEQYRVQVVFTAEDETADSYIERVAGEMNSRLTQVSVATSDLAEQWIIFQKGALRKSAREFYQEIQRSYKKQRELSQHYQTRGRMRWSPWNDEQWITLDRLRYELDE